MDSASVLDASVSAPSWIQAFSFLLRRLAPVSSKLFASHVSPLFLFPIHALNSSLSNLWCKPARHSLLFARNQSFQDSSNENMQMIANAIGWKFGPIRRHVQSDTNTHQTQRQLHDHNTGPFPDNACPVRRIFQVRLADHRNLFVCKSLRQHFPVASASLRMDSSHKTRRFCHFTICRSSKGCRLQTCAAPLYEVSHECSEAACSSLWSDRAPLRCRQPRPGGLLNRGTPGGRRDSAGCVAHRCHGKEAKRRLSTLSL